MLKPVSLTDDVEVGLKPSRGAPKRAGIFGSTKLSNCCHMSFLTYQ